MKRRLDRSMLATLAALAALIFAAPAAHADGSGFLADYSQLKTVTDTNGVERQVWFKDGVDFSRYTKVIIDAVQFYPAPQPSERVSAGTLNDLRNYLERALRLTYADATAIVDQPGPEVARLRSAITAVGVDTGLKPQQLIPIVLIFNAAKRATGTASYDVKLQAEFELVDTMTGEVLARVVREAKKVQVTGDQPLTLDLAKPQIDNWVAASRAEIALRRGGK